MKKRFKESWSEEASKFDIAWANFEKRAGKFIQEKGINFAILYFLKTKYVKCKSWTEACGVLQITERRRQTLFEGGKFDAVELAKCCVAVNVLNRDIYMLFLITGNHLMQNTSKICQAKDLLDIMFMCRSEDREDWNDMFPMERLNKIGFPQWKFKYK